MLFVVVVLCFAVLCCSFVFCRVGWHHHDVVVVGWLVGGGGGGAAVAVLGVVVVRWL